MSVDIESKIVDLKFKADDFQKNISGALSSLSALDRAILSGGSKEGLTNVADAADGVAGRFSALQAVALGVFATIGSRAVDLGMQMLRGMTLEPILDGFGEYELKMGSIQTILANTSKAGTTLDDVSRAFEDLNAYSDKTIYNFADMTKNIGLFTNAGIGLQDATDMIRGFSNEAASSGVSAEAAAGAAYQLSQALSAGTIRLMDWRSLTNVGMGSQNMKQSLVDIAEAMGTFTDTTITGEIAMQNFNGSLEEQWLTADVMTNYLKIQAGVMTDEQMRNIGLTNEQIEAFKKQQEIAEAAATKIRTFSALTGTIKESIGSTWAATFELIIGEYPS